MRSYRTGYADTVLSRQPAFTYIDWHEWRSGHDYLLEGIRTLFQAVVRKRLRAYLGQRLGYVGSRAVVLFSLVIVGVTVIPVAGAIAERASGVSVVSSVSCLFEFPLASCLRPFVLASPSLPRLFYLSLFDSSPIPVTVAVVVPVASVVISVVVVLVPISAVFSAVVASVIPPIGILVVSVCGGVGRRIGLRRCGSQDA